jgi:hypothetical protein
MVAAVLTFLYVCENRGFRIAYVVCGESTCLYLLGIIVDDVKARRRGKRERIDDGGCKTLRSAP